jgi:hypothetical protein
MRTFNAVPFQHSARLPACLGTTYEPVDDTLTLSCNLGITEHILNQEVRIHAQ